MARATGWSSREWPDGCRDCGDVEKRHFGRGLCGSCYKKRARAGTLGELDVTSILDSEQERADDIAALGFGDSIVPAEKVPGSAPPVTDFEPTPLGVDGKKKRSFFKREPRAKRPKLPDTNEKTPGGKTPRRVSTADSVEDLWIGVGGMLERAGKHAPLGRYLSWQASGAGEVVDGAVANTYVDRKVLQPVVKARSSLDAIAAVAGPPLIILAIERSPEKFAFNVDGSVDHPLLPLLASSIRSSLPTLLPAMKKAAQKKEKVDAAIREMFPDLAPGEDVVNSVLSTMFEGWLITSDAPEEEHAAAQS